MAKKLERRRNDSETLHRLLRQTIQLTESDYPLTSYLLRIALESLEDEMRKAVKETAEIEMRYS